MIVPASWSLSIINAFSEGVQFVIDFEPAVVFIPIISTLSFTIIGTQNSDNSFYH
jgi:hypothetical protein